MALAFLLALRGCWLAMIPLTILATLNKEVFIVYLLTLFPLVRMRASTVKALLISGATIAVGGATHLIVLQIFACNPGGPESWLRESIKFYTDLSNLIAFEVNFGVVTPRAYSLFTFHLLAALIIAGWRRLSSTLRQHTWMALTLNAPLVLFFCGPGEMRNFSICFIALFIFIAVNTQRWVETVEARTPTGALKT